MKRADGTYDNSDHLQYCHDMYNSTGDTQYLWDMYDDMLHLVQSVLIKDQKGYIYKDLHEDAIMITEKWLCNFITRREKGKPYHIVKRAWVSWARYSILNWKPKDQGYWARTYQFPDIQEDELYYSYEDDITNQQNIIFLNTQDNLHDYEDQ